MRRLLSRTVFGWTSMLLLSAGTPARADEAFAAVSAAPSEAVAAVPAAEGTAAVAAVPTGKLPEDAVAPPPALDPAWRDALAPTSSRPARRWSTSAEVDSSAYRVSLSRGRLDMGLGFDTAPHPTTATTTARSIDPSRPIVPTLPSLSVGMRTVSPGPVPSSLVARATERAAETPTQRVGVEWKPVQSRLFVRGGLGLRLSGDDQVTMKLRSGRVGIYMKSTF